MSCDSCGERKLCACKNAVKSSTLLVDDDTDIQSMVQVLLEEQGHSVTIAGTLKEALELLQQQTFDLVLLDEELPDGRGSMLLMEQKRGAFEEMPIMMLTGNSGTGFAVECLKAGAVDFVVKPFRPDYLPMLVDRVLVATALEKEAEALRVRAEVAERTITEKTKFLHILNHELKTPLTPILALEQLLDDEALFNQFGPDMLRQAISAGERLERLIDRCMRLSRIRDQESLPTHTIVSASDILQLCILECAPMAEEKGLILVNASTESETNIRADCNWLKDAIHILVRNAIRFTDKGRITLSAEPCSDDTIEIKISDTGIGIHSDQLNEIFEIFTQADMSHTRRFGGVGLGLTLAKELIESMDGEICVTSDTDGGSVFCLSMPRALTTA